jgi:hypothetical protein
VRAARLVPLTAERSAVEPPAAFAAGSAAVTPGGGYGGGCGGGYGGGPILPVGALAGSGPDVG